MACLDESLPGVVCGEPACDKAAECKGRCRPHYKRAWKRARRRQSPRAPGAAYANSRSGVRNVSWDKHRRKWIAVIQHRNQLHNLGFYGTLTQAATAVASKRATLAWADRLAAERERTARLEKAWAADVGRHAGRTSWAHR